MYSKFRNVIWFEQLYVVTWSEKELVHNCTVLNFHRIYPLVSVVKLICNVLGGSRNCWILKNFVSSEAKWW